MYNISVNFDDDEVMIAREAEKGLKRIKRQKSRRISFLCKFFMIQQVMINRRKRNRSTKHIIYGQEKGTYNQSKYTHDDCLICVL